MNPNWTGRAARTLGDCRFTDDADPFSRDAAESRTEKALGVLLAVVIGVALAWLLVHGLSS